MTNAQINLDWLTHLVDSIGPGWTTAIIGLLLAAGMLYIILLLIRRSDKDTEAARKALSARAEDLEEDITENRAEQWRLMAQIEQLKLELNRCQEMLERSGIGGLSPAEEKILRDMLVSKQNELVLKQNEIDRLKNIINQSGL